MKPITKINTFLPIFTGFYGTIFEADEESSIEIDYINERRAELKLPEVDSDAIDFDYQTYYQEIAKGCVDHAQETLTEILGGEIQIEFKELISPKYYNFTNDSIDVLITMDKQAEESMQKYLLENNKLLADYLEEHFKSRSGFISFYDHDIKTWGGEYYTNMDEKYHILGSLIDFIMKNEDEEAELNMYYRASEEVYLLAKNYEELIPENN
jgi:hypothetical protein